MGRHNPLIKELADRLRGMDVTSLVYFHTDHFEPWRPVGGAPAVGPGVVEAIYDFCRVTERIDFARRLTLFYKPHLNYALRSGAGLERADSDDLVGFLPRAEHEERYGREAMQEIVASTAHDIQLHIHHEYYTATTAHTDPEVVAWFSSPLGRSLDERRLELAIRLNREISARETGRNPVRWFFVHGHWALNASDPSSCTITNEIEILLRNGCRGDFTFPAGRAHTNPRILVPYLCSPFRRPKGYDCPEAEPEVACGNASAAAGKFFIWSSPASSRQCSIDYLSEGTRQHLENTEKAARELIDNAYVVDGRIFIKTHSHSMHPHYFEHARMPVFPHQYPATQALLSVIFDAATRAGVDVTFATAPEVYDLLVEASVKPRVDLAATYLQQRGLFGAAVRALKRRPSRESSAGAGSPALAVPLEPERIVELVRQTAADVMQKRLESHGVRGSGAYEHYSGMLREGFAVPGYELTALDIVRQQVPRLDAYHEIGSGIGMFSCLLALNGYPAVAIEHNVPRHEAARAIWKALGGKVDLGKSSCQMILGRFPAAVSGIDTARAIAIVTNLVSTQSPIQLKGILAGLRRYQYVLIDLQRFCIMRGTGKAQAELLDELRALDFEPLSSPTGVECAFVLLRNRSIVETRPRSALWSRLASSYQGGRSSPSGRKGLPRKH